MRPFAISPAIRRLVTAPPIALKSMTSFLCNVAARAGRWPTDTTSPRRSPRLRSSLLLQLDFQLDRRIVRVENLTNIHCEGLEPAHALVGGPTLRSRWYLPKQFQEQRVKVQAARISVIAVSVTLLLFLVGRRSEEHTSE